MKKSILIFVVMFLTSFSQAQVPVIRAFIVSKVDTVSIVRVGTSKLLLSNNQVISRDRVYGDLLSVGTKLQRVTTDSIDFVTVSEELLFPFRENETIDYFNSNNHLTHEFTFERTSSSVYLGGRFAEKFFFAVDRTETILCSKIYNRTLPFGNNEKAKIPLLIVIVDPLL